MTKQPDSNKRSICPHTPDVDVYTIAYGQGELAVLQQYVCVNCYGYYMGQGGYYKFEKAAERVLEKIERGEDV